MKFIKVISLVIAVTVIISISLFAGCGDDVSSSITSPSSLAGPTGPTGATGSTGVANLINFRVNVTNGSNPIEGFTANLRRIGEISSSEIYGSDISGNGWYEFSQIYPGQYLLTISADGYDTKILDVDTSAVQELDVSLGRWDVQYSRTSDPYSILYDVHFIDSETGWAVGADGSNLPLIVFTDNGGDTWTEQPFSAGAYALYGVHFLDENRGWAVGDMQEIIYTEDGGANWQENTSAGGPPGYSLYRVFFADENNGWAVGDGETILYHTGSMTDPWTVQSPGLTAGFYPLFGLYFSDENNGWAVGGEFTILRTRDGGSTWSDYCSENGTSIYGINFLDINNGLATGSDFTIMKTSDGGTTWTEMDVPVGSTSIDLRDVEYVSSDRIWTVSDGLGKVGYSTNSGNDWILSNTPVEFSGELRGLSFPSPDEGWAVGSGGTIIHYSE